MREKKGIQIGYVTMILNTFLGIIKILIGITGFSQILVADGLHSLSDSITTIGVIVGFKLSGKDPDACHPYGHEKIESVIALILSTILFMTAFLIGYQAIGTYFISQSVNTPRLMTLYAAFVSILFKEIMYLYTMHYGRLLKSPLLKADAWHHQSDALSSTVALIGIIALRYFNLPGVEFILTLVISVIIMNVAISLWKDAANQVVDHSANDKIVTSIYNQINDVEGIRQIDDLKTRYHVNKIYVEIEISVEAEMNIVEAHAIAEDVHKRVESIDNSIKHCMVHVNPFPGPTFH